MRGSTLIWAIASMIASAQQQPFAPDIPKVWHDEAMATFELPLATPGASPKHVPADYYYRIPVRKIYKSYPSFVAGRDPDEYRNWLKQQEPQILFDVAKLQTREDWVPAGKIVFEAPAVIGRPE